MPAATVKIVPCFQGGPCRPAPSSVLPNINIVSGYCLTHVGQGSIRQFYSAPLH